MYGKLLVKSTCVFLGVKTTGYALKASKLFCSGFYEGYTRAAKQRDELKKRIVKWKEEGLSEEEIQKKAKQFIEETDKEIQDYYDSKVNPREEEGKKTTPP